MKKPELLSVGAWAPIDHLFLMEHYPEEGETLTVQSEGRNYYYGDCSLNIAVAAAKLGIRAGIATVVGEDFEETGYESYLKQREIDIERIVKAPGQKCGHNYLYFDSNGDGFCFSEMGAAKEQDRYLLTKEEVEGISHVVVSEKFGAYTLQALRLAKEAGARTYINGMIDTADTQMLEEFLLLADVIFMNNSEYRRLCRKLGEKDLLQAYGIEKLFVTDGKRGSTVYNREGTLTEKAVSAPVVKDTTGAGDSFAAGVIAALIRGLPDEQAIRIGAVVSSMIVREWGCQTNAPAWEEMEREYKKYFSCKEEGYENH